MCSHAHSLGSRRAAGAHLSVCHGAGFGRQPLVHGPQHRGGLPLPDAVRRCVAHPPTLHGGQARLSPPLSALTVRSARLMRSDSVHNR